MSQRMRTAAIGTIASLFLCLLVRSCGRGTGAGPQIAFSKVPDADTGGPQQSGLIQGHTIGAKAGQQIDVYTKSEGRWWVQPLAQNPFTKIESDSTWKNEIHFGTDYAAFLVDPGYIPPASVDELPERDSRVRAMAVARGQGADASPLTILHFSGYDWAVRTAPSRRGGWRNTFNPANAWVDGDGALHLRITKDGEDRWSCAEVVTTRRLGYGTYVFVVRDISRLERSAVLTLFTWDGGGPEQNRRELAFEISHWGNPRDQDNTAFVVQPYCIPTNVVRFRAPAGVVTNMRRNRSSLRSGTRRLTNLVVQVAVPGGCGFPSFARVSVSVSPVDPAT